MNSKEDFEFLNSDIWLKYTQQRYASLTDIKHRLETLNISNEDWPKTKQKIQYFRKMAAIPLFVNSIDKKFWFFLSDSINKKIFHLESTGNKLFDKINSHGTFKQEFLTNAAIEEAITSAIYEGANSTRSKAKALIASGKKAANTDEHMLVNNWQAMQWIKKNSNRPLSKQSILKVHEIVSQNTLENDDANFCGLFRNDAVHIGNHEGVEWDKIEASLDEVINLTTNNPRYLHPLIKGILLHYFIGYIHPFFDGNGRTARTVFYLKAIKNDLKFVELLSVSSNLKNRGKMYEKSFDLAKEHDLDITYFIDFCLDSLTKALEDIEKKVEYLINISNLKEHAGLSQTQVMQLQKMALNKHSAISIEEYAAAIEKSREIARKELKDLLSKGLLREEKQSKKFIYFIQSKKLKNLVEQYSQTL